MAFSVCLPLLLVFYDFSGDRNRYISPQHEKKVPLFYRAQTKSCNFESQNNTRLNPGFYFKENYF